jgi:hypothetical protein
LIGLIFERNSVTVSPDAPQLKSFSIATPKPEEIELRLVAEKIDRDRFG